MISLGSLFGGVTAFNTTTLFNTAMEDFYFPSVSVMVLDGLRIEQRQIVCGQIDNVLVWQHNLGYTNKTIRFHPDLLSPSSPYTSILTSLLRRS